MHLTESDTRESMRDYAFRIITDNIIRLELKPGSMVSEKELADEMGLSRGPIREALIELARVKIVEVYPQRGISIAMIDFELIDEARFMRETLECAVAERCCQRPMEPRIAAALQENLKLQQFYKDNLDHWNFHKLWNLDKDFHRLLFLCANASQIHALMSSMLVHFNRVRAMAVTEAKEIEFVGEHTQVLAAIENRDADAARESMRKHLNCYQIDKAALLKRYPEYIKV